MNRADVYALIDAERSWQSVKWSAPHAWGQGGYSTRNHLYDHLRRHGTRHLITGRNG